MFKVLSIILAGLLIIVSALYLKTFLVSKNSPQNFLSSVSQSLTGTQSAPIEDITLDTVQLMEKAGNKYADGNLPLGDKKYVTDAPKKGYIYLCNVHGGGGGAQHTGPWIDSTTWNFQEKITVAGSKSWPNAQFTNKLAGQTRSLSGNDLPISHTTGTFPIQSSDPAYQYDRNPNTISAQSFSKQLPANPVLSETPYCMGGEAGIMLTGVALFNGFDADYRDAAAYEVQDSCGGHPEKTSQYHYHNLSSCIHDVSVSTVIGFALDGFPITGPKVDKDKYLVTDDLDECHGLTSEITLDGKKVSSYHYVMTQDFPYSVSCFRGKPAGMKVIEGQNSGISEDQRQGQESTGGQRQPPQEAITACATLSKGSNCKFTAPNGQITGVCNTPPNMSSLICIPQQQPL